MEESEVIEGKANQGNNFDTQTFDTEKENFALKSKGKILQWKVKENFALKSKGKIFNSEILKNKGGYL